MEHDGTGVLDADSADEDTTGWLRDAAVAVPVQPGRLPDGRPSLTMGDVSGYAALNHLQGDNPEHDRGDCGIVSCAEVLNQFGVRVTEADAFVHATRCRELHVVPGRPDQSGWTLPADQAAILTDYGVPAHAEEAQPVERLALAVQHGHGVIAMVNCGVLWSNPRALEHGQANHAVTITGIARDRYDGTLLGLYINDSGTGQSGQFVSAHLMTTAFEHEGGFCVVTDCAQALCLAGCGRVSACGEQLTVRKCEVTDRRRRAEDGEAGVDDRPETLIPAKLLFRRWSWRHRPDTVAAKSGPPAQSYSLRSVCPTCSLAAFRCGQAACALATSRATGLIISKASSANGG